ncbi:MAG: PilN domain-containing protein [Deltaproteobacteria bacterium]|nr:PilN domain-containing protein [Deltaproteobacteria bacterium]
MIKITINLATKRYVGKGFGKVLPIAVIFIGVLFSLYIRERATNYENAIDRLKNRISQLPERQPGSTDGLKDMELPAVDLAAVSDIVEEKSFSWIGALDNIENALPSNISLSSIQPSFKEGGIKLSGQARDFSTLSRFIDNLEGLKVYKRVFLIGHSVKETDEGKTAVVFNISIEGNK